MDIKADGQDQTVTGSNYFDTRSVKVADDHTVAITDKKGGKTIYTETDTVSSDGAVSLRNLMISQKHSLSRVKSQ
jgi:hypothetical protein